MKNYEWEAGNPLIDQGDFPVNMSDVERREEESSTMPENDEYLESVHSDGGVESGINMARSMYPYKMIRKNTHY